MRFGSFLAALGAPLVAASCVNSPNLTLAHLWPVSLAAVARGVAEEGLLLREVLEVLLDADDLGRALGVLELVWRRSSSCRPASSSTGRRTGRRGRTCDGNSRDRRRDGFGWLLLCLFVNVVVAVVADKPLPPRALTGRSAAARRRRGCRVDQPLAKVGGAAGPRQALGIRACVHYLHAGTPVCIFRS